MNRCKKASHAPRSPHTPHARILMALCLALVGAGALLPAPARAQFETEAMNGGRNFPNGTLRGKFQVVSSPDILLDGQPERLAPGARIRSAQNMLTMPMAIAGQNLLVNYTRDAAGLVSQVWILTPEEAVVKRESAERPLLNFWPFVASTPTRDDGKIPFDQLPKYGQ
jgi:hypothetical protein